MQALGSNLNPFWLPAGKSGEAAERQRQCVELLLRSKGVNVNAATEVGDTALAFCGEFCNVELFKLLLAKGGSPSIEATNEDVSLRLAC